MVKGVEKGVEIRAVRLLEKDGGRSGAWRRPPDEPERSTRSPRSTKGGRAAGRIHPGPR
jgi:hypothetical protein